MLGQGAALREAKVIKSCQQEDWEMYRKNTPATLMPCNMASGRYEGLEPVREAWSQLVCLDVMPVEPTAPKLSASIWSVGDLKIGAFDGSAVKMARTTKLAQDFADDLIICIERKTPTRATWGGAGERVFVPGDIHLWRADGTMQCETKGAFSALLLSIPRTVLSNHGIDIAPLLRQGGICGNSPETRLLCRYTDSVLGEVDALSPMGVSHCLSHLVDLAMLVLGGRNAVRLANRHRVRSVRLASIKSDIDAHLLNPELSVGWVLRRHRISERYLRSLFADEDTSFTRFVLERRLMRAHAALDQSGRSISEIAYDCGFSDLSWFNRAFRQRFDMTPSQARAGLLDLSLERDG